MAQVFDLIVTLLKDILLFSKHGSGVTLREYQVQVALAVVDSVIHRDGRSFVVMFPRQSGKNELQAGIEVYFLTLFSQIGGEIVKVSPTWKPQSQNAMRRLEHILGCNLLTRGRWHKESGYIYRVGQARIYFLSGSEQANIVGATASVLLEVDEAQDILISKYDKDVNPMAASTNATRIFWGTAWTSQTLLARELRAARQAEMRDGKKRVFMINADVVSLCVPEYGTFVNDQIAKLGRNHPMVRTQFFSEEIDSDSGMFPDARRLLMVGRHSFTMCPVVGKVYAFLLDVAGEDEGKTKDGSGLPGDMAGLKNAGRDSTALTIVEVDLSTLADDALHAPTYRVVCRHQWIGDKQTLLYGAIKGLAGVWGPRAVVIDATGIGAGLASFLEKSMPGKVFPFVFNSSTKSKLGWDFLSIIETGRFKDGMVVGMAPSDQIKLKALFDVQLEYTMLEVILGPAHNIRWGVQNGFRDKETGETLHDDFVMSAALSAVLDGLEWTSVGESAIIHVHDVLEDLDRRGGF